MRRAAEVRRVGTPGGRATQRVESIEQRLARKRDQLDRAHREVAGLESSLHNWQAGLEGELRVATVLEVLHDEGWQLLHDVAWPGRARANLDHVAVGPGGVFVVDAKLWSGSVTVNRGRLWNGSWPKTRQCEAAAQMSSDVASLLDPEHRTAVVAVICLVGHPIAPTPVEAGVLALGDMHLADHLRSLPRRFDDDDVQAVAAELRELLAGPTSPAVLTAPEWEQHAAPPVERLSESSESSEPPSSVLGAVAPVSDASVALPTRRSRLDAEALAAGRTPRERRVRRRPAPSLREYLLVRLGLLGLVVAGLVAWANASR